MYLNTLDVCNFLEVARHWPERDHSSGRVGQSGNTSKHVGAPLQTVILIVLKYQLKCVSSIPFLLAAQCSLMSAAVSEETWVHPRSAELDTAFGWTMCRSLASSLGNVLMETLTRMRCTGRIRALVIRTLSLTCTRLQGNGTEVDKAQDMSGLECSGSVVFGLPRRPLHGQRNG